MFRCKDVSQKISQSMDSALPIHHRMAIRFHLMMCRHCARFRRQLVMLRKMAGHMEGHQLTGEMDETLSEAAKSRIKETLRSLT